MWQILFSSTSLWTMTIGIFSFLEKYAGKPELVVGKLKKVIL